jgi:transcriptional regulator with XRE-family HTH domain
MCFWDMQFLDKQLLGHRIRQARERKGLSQEDFAALISRDQRAVSEYEHGKRRIAANDLPEFARVLGVPVRYFYEGDTALDDIDAIMIDQLRRLTDSDDKRSAVELVRVFCDALERRSDN